MLSALLAVAMFADPASEARRAQELIAAGRPAEAIGIYRTLLAASPRNPALLLNLTIAEYKARKFREAIMHASEALAVEPDLAPAKLFLGASYLELGEFTKAAEWLAQVPQDRNARLMLGEALLGAGQTEAAMGHFPRSTPASQACRSTNSLSPSRWTPPRAAP